MQYDYEKPKSNSHEIGVLFDQFLIRNLTDYFEEKFLELSSEYLSRTLLFYKFESLSLRLQTQIYSFIWREEKVRKSDFLSRVFSWCDSSSLDEKSS